MKVLFIHQNFPAQFLHLAPALAADAKNDIRVLTTSKRPVPAGIKVHHYAIKRSSSENIHPWLVDMETKTIRAEAAYRAAMDLKKQGFTPDLIIAHPGWGESLFLKEVWPTAKLALYCEFYYQTHGADTNFDPEFTAHEQGLACRLKLKNANFDLHLLQADAGLSPTHYQRSVFPDYFQSKISVIHDGIDTNLLKPNPAVTMQLNDKTITRDEQIITFVNRNLEPMRGYHIFMRALPEILKRNPKARVIIVGGDDVSYGSKPPPGTTWKELFLQEVKSQLDMNRVHFVGKLSYPNFIQLLQISSMHVYLTYPFVLSWSLLEAMSVGCAIVGSNTSPVQEVIKHNGTGLLVDFFDKQALVEQVTHLLKNPQQREQLGNAARKFVLRNYDLKSECLPAQKQWLEGLLN
ncbi:glycosyltransferase [Cellvibrio sp. KY-GH-1]|uniref:glycosyltransferase family 4 protein n=1 Tax=Cellvibrio sp. KY-GH-1 TaxID=2303332 RepID=UPI0012476884|nr:glycosyltransferase family 4 protein [Cellvibrio sp. KY-GH-1]QEY15527.1 glycosyltransferase [Cellvibrio sp. KY-GH-1]